MSEIMVEVSKCFCKNFIYHGNGLTVSKSILLKKLKTRLSMMSLWRFRMSALLWKKESLLR